MTNRASEGGSDEDHVKGRGENQAIFSARVCGVHSGRMKVKKVKDVYTVV